VLIRLV